MTIELNFYVPATALPGVLEGWCGPTERRIFGREWHHSPWDEEELRPGVEIRLDTRREEVRDRIARWKRAAGTPIDHIMQAERTGTLSPEHVAACVAWCARTGRGLEVLGPWEDTTNKRDAYYEWGYEKQERRTIAITKPQTCVCYSRRAGFNRKTWGMEGWGLGWTIRASGPETGPAGRAAADAAALLNDIAYIDNGQLVLPPETR